MKIMKNKYVANAVVDLHLSRVLSSTALMLNLMNQVSLKSPLLRKVKFGSVLLSVINAGISKTFYRVIYLMICKYEASDRKSDSERLCKVV